jgi:hypothetical protein
MAWSPANAWASNLNPYSSGITGWRLPTVNDAANPGYTYTDINQGVDTGYNITAHSEMSHMFYETLGNGAQYSTDGTSAGCTAPNWCLSNTGPFSNLQANYYWSSTPYALDSTGAWYFGFWNGYQAATTTSTPYYAWAVHNGDVGTAIVPLPGAIWLFGSGLLGLIGITRKK